MGRCEKLFLSFFGPFYYRLPSPSRSINQHRLITNRSCSHLSVEWISEATSSGERGGGGGKKGISTRKGTEDDPEDGLVLGTIVPLLTGLLPS